jgi:type III secretion protein T
MDYLTYLFSIPDLSPVSLLTLFVLTLFRIAPIVRLAPFLGAKLVPTTARMGIVIALSLVFLPNIVAFTPHDLSFDLAFVGYALKELLIGFGLGLLVAVPFFVASSAGIFIDFMRGSSQLMQQDITMQQQASPLGIVYNYILIVIYYQLDGPFLFFDALLKSYEIMPPNVLINTKFLNLSAPYWKTGIDFLNHIVDMALRIAAPALVAVLMAELFLGIANRLAPQVQIAFLGMALKSLIGILLLWAGWFFILKQTGNQAIDWTHKIDQIIQSMKPFILKP